MLLVLSDFNNFLLGAAQQFSAPADTGLFLRLLAGRRLIVNVSLYRPSGGAGECRTGHD